jgi:hypothetical protein
VAQHPVSSHGVVLQALTRGRGAREQHVVPCRSEFELVNDPLLLRWGVPRVRALEVEKDGRVRHVGNPAGIHRHRRILSGMDPLDDAQTPRCPHCGTVLRDARAGYRCETCELDVIRTVGSL